MSMYLSSVLLSLQVISLRSLHFLPVCQRTDFTILLLVYALSFLNTYKNTFLICSSVMNHPHLSDNLGQVCFMFPESKLNTEKQHPVFMHHIYIVSGTNSQKTSHLLQLSVLVMSCLVHVLLYYLTFYSTFLLFDKSYSCAFLLHFVLMPFMSYVKSFVLPLLKTAVQIKVLCYYLINGGKGIKQSVTVVT